MCSTEQNLHSGKSSLTACFVQKSDFQSKEQNALMIRHLYKGIELPLGVQEFTTILYSLPLLVDEHSVPVPSRAVHFLVTAFVIRVQAFHPSHCELLTRLPWPRPPPAHRHTTGSLCVLSPFSLKPLHL